MRSAVLLLILIAFPALASAQPSRSQPPPPPSEVNVKRGDGTLSASWSAVPGATHYHVTYSDTDGASWTLAAAAHTWTSIVIKGVRNEASYLVGVRARTAQGWTGWRNSSVVDPQRPRQVPPQPVIVVPPNQPPRPVQRVDVTRADGALTASWDTVASATAYDITYSDDGMQSWELAAADHGATSITINVDNDQTYIVGVRAENQHGASSWRNSAPAGPWTPPAPNAPTGLIAVADEDSATIQWNDPGDASITGYQYQIREDGGDWGGQTPIEGGGASTTSHKIGGLAQGTTYQINLQALNAGGASAAAQTQAVLPGLLPGPANLTVTRGTGTITASWDALPGAYRYWIDSFNHTDGYSHRQHSESTTSTSITLSGANDSLNYIVRIYARGDFGTSGFSESAPVGTLTSPPLAPGWVGVTRSPSGVLTASWPAVVGAASYNVNISGDRGKTWARQVSEHTGTTWTVANVDADTDYIIAVQTKNSAGVSGWTKSAVNTPAPPAPASVSVDTRSGAALNVSWTAVTNASSYNVRSSADNGGTWSTASSVTSGTTTTLTLDATKDYLVGVQAVNSKGASGWAVSDTSYATPIPPAPTNVSDTRGKGTIRLTWDASAGATSYEVACNPFEAAYLWTSCDTGADRVASFSTYYNWVTKQNHSISDHRTYLFAVRAKNASGASEWTRYTVWLAAPNRIASISATRTASDITLSWTVPAANGGYPIVYMDVQCRTSSDGGTTWSSWFNCADQSARNPAVGSTFSAVVDSQDSYDTTLTYQARARGRNGLGVGEWRESAAIDPFPILTASDVTAATATLTLTGRTGGWWLKQTAPSAGNCTAGEADYSHALRSLTANTTYTYKAYSDSSCTTANELASETFTTPITLTSSGVTATTATLTIAGHSGAWYYIADAAPDNSCTGPVSGTTKALTALSPGTTYTYKAYSDATCTTGNLLASASAFSTPASFTASEITKTSATLTLVGRTGNWWLKKTAPTPAGSCTAGEADYSHALSNLVKVTSYTYKAYSASTCSSSNEIVTVSFSTTGDPGDSDTSSEFDAADDNQNAYGLWSDGTTIWTSDFIRGKMFAYTLAGGARDASKDFSLHADNGNTADIWSDGTTIWASDNGDDKIYAYTLATGARDTAKEFDLDTANDLPYGIWSDGTTIWVSDFTDAKLYAYSLAGGARDTAKEFDLDSANTAPTGIWSDGTTIWVADFTDKVLYAYTLATGAREGPKDINLNASGGQPTAIWSDGTRIWVSANQVDKLRVYYMPEPTKRLIASNVTATGADLSITWQDEAWWYQRTAPSGDSTCHSVAAGTTSVSLSSLSTGTSYTYKAYGKSGCAGADEIATASFSTPVTGDRDTSKEFDAHADNTDIAGIWSNDTTMWMLDRIDNKIYAYTQASGVRDSAKEISLHSDNDNGSGLWSNGTTIWTTDDSDNKIYAYTLATGARDTAKEFSLDSANDTPISLWSNGVTIWVTDATDDKLYAYTLSGGARDSGKDIDLPADNAHPHGIWSDRTTIWVADYNDDKLYAYTLASGARDTTRELDLDADNGNPTDLWSDGVTMWVSDSSDDKLYSYAYAYKSSLAKGLTASPVAKTTATLNLANHSTAWWYKRTAGSPADSTCHSVAAGTSTVDLSSLTRNTSYTHKAYSRSGCASAYEMATLTFVTVGNPGDHHAAKDLSMHSDNSDLLGIWSDDTTIWVVDGVDDKLYAYTLASGARDTSKDFSLGAGNNHAKGIWSDGATIWVADSSDRKLYAYTLAGGTRDSGKDVNLNSANIGAYDIWSNGVTIWVADIAVKKIYAYTLATGARDTSKEFSLHADNGDPIGIWSDDTTLWVVDNSDKKIYAYTMATGARDTTKEISLQSGNTNSGPAWSNGATIWVTDSFHDKLFGYYMHPPTKRLTASDIGVMGATLNITWHTAAWWYQRSAGSPADSTCHSVAAATSSASLSALSGGTSYTYKAYDKSGCDSADEIATGSFTTLAYGSSDAAKDLSSASANGDFIGIWSDGTTLWTADGVDDKLYAYTLATGARDASKEFSISSAGNNHPTGLWSDGTTIWVADDTDDKLYAYTLAGGARDTGKEFNLHASNRGPYDLWSDGTTIWVADNIDKKVYAYTLATGARDSAKEFSLHTDNGAPLGIWSDGTTLWVVDNTDRKLYAYTLAGGARDTSKEISLRSGNDNPGPIWSNGATIWVADLTDDKLYAYYMHPPAKRLSASDIVPNGATLNIAWHTAAWWYQRSAGSPADSTCHSVAAATSSVTLSGLTENSSYTYKAYDKSGCASADEIATGSFTTLAHGASDPASEINLHTDNSDVLDIWSDGTTIWVVDDSDDKLFAYTLASGARDTAKEFSLHAHNSDPGGIWSNGTLIWVLDYGDLKLYVYNLASGSRTTLREFNLVANNSLPRGLWSDGTTIWVSDYADNKLYAYTLASGGRDSAKDRNMSSVNTGPTGIWSDGTTIWVSDYEDSKLYAYSLATRMREASREFNTDTDNARPAGLWWDGATMWVSDYEDAKLYAYHVSTVLTAGSVGATTATLSIGGHSGNWYYKANAAPDASCTGPVSGTTKALTGLTTGTTYTYQAYSDSTCTAANLLAIAGAFTPTSLTASGVSVTKATLTIAGDGSAWWYQRTAPTGDSTCHSVAASTTSASLSSLSGSTTYTYRAYDKSGCAGADAIATASFSTPAFGSSNTSREFNVHSDSTDPTGGWSDGTTIWVADSADDKLYAYTLATGARDTTKEFSLHSDNGDAYGIWSNGTTIWVTDLVDDKLYAYTLAGGARDSAKDVSLVTGHQHPYGLWSNGTTVWVSDYFDGKLYAYTLSSGARDASKDISLAGGNSAPTALWSDGTTIWVVDYSGDKFYAYTLSTRARNTAKEFNLHSANGGPYGLWSDGTTIWVVDGSDNKLYAYYIN